MGRYLVTELKEHIKEHRRVSTPSNEMYEVLKNQPFIHWVDRPSGRYLHSIDLSTKSEELLMELIDGHSWYVERGREGRYTISQKYVEEARVETPVLLYHATPVKNMENIMREGLVPRSEDIRHRYPLRIYVSDNVGTLKNLIPEMRRWKGPSEYVILRIDTSGLDLDVYKDTTSAYKGHYYIQDSGRIPSENISVVVEGKG